MNRHYQKVNTLPVGLVPEEGFLTSSIIEVYSDVAVEEYREGFDSSTFGDEGFEAVFE